MEGRRATQLGRSTGRALWRQLSMARPDSAAGRGWGALRTLHTGRQTHWEHGKPARHTWFHAPPEGGGRAAAGGRGSRHFPRLRGCEEGYCLGAITLTTRSGEPPSKTTGLPSRPEASCGTPPAEEMRPATALPMLGVVPAEEIRQTPT
ncbi:hypothetical protein chiPu_0024469 [Chiloscyllium punctatum]|uniref:Uncharacterized protein n=1 Tax=Chiloscyllium punctatum TaxID=137246 RepID=A0A401TDH8_CHIPU|nr:hypothetical protein [Chiloscyllium punctatum]